MPNFTVVSDAARFKSLSKELVSGNHKLAVIADGAVTAYLDASSLMRQGINMAATVQFVSVTNAGAPTAFTCIISGSLDDRGKFLHPAKWPSIVFAGTALVTLNPGDVFSFNPKVYSGFKLVFNGQGEARFLTA